MSVFGYIQDIFKRPKLYAKFWTALGTLGLSLLARYFGTAMWLPDVLQAAGVLGVFVVPNKK